MAVPTIPQIAAFQQQGDSLADATIDVIFRQHDINKVNQLLGTLVTNEGFLSVRNTLALSNTALVALDWYIALGSELPPWKDDQLIAQGQQLFEKYGLIAFSILGCASLPEAYATDYASRVLGITQELVLHVQRRILETSLFVMDVASPGGLERQGSGIASALKVRLMHAAVRRLILQPPPQGPPPGRPSLGDKYLYLNWPKQNGMPIHQIAMSMAALSFSYIVLRSLKKLGIQLTEDQDRAYLHLWNVTGHVMGVDDRLAPQTFQEAAQLYEAVWPASIKLTPDGTRLEKALLDYLADFVPAVAFPLRRLPRVMSRYLMSDEVCAALGLELTWSEWIALAGLDGACKTHALASSILGAIGLELRPVNKAASWTVSSVSGLPHLSAESLGELTLSRLALEWLFRQMAEQLRGRQRSSRPPFRIPDKFASAWRLR